jgi:hypothetical protein
VYFLISALSLYEYRISLSLIAAANSGLQFIAQMYIQKITKIKMGSSCNENGENKNHKKNNRMDSI